MFIAHTHTHTYIYIYIYTHTQIIQLIDAESALRIHVSNRRRMIRSIQVYVQNNGKRTQSDIFRLQKRRIDETEVATRFNCVFLWLANTHSSSLLSTSSSSHCLRGGD